MKMIRVDRVGGEDHEDRVCLQVCVSSKWTTRLKHHSWALKDRKHFFRSESWKDLQAQGQGTGKLGVW